MSRVRFVEIDLTLPGGTTVEVSAGAEQDGLCVCLDVDRDSLLDLAARLDKAAEEARALAR